MIRLGKVSVGVVTRDGVSDLLGGGLLLLGLNGRSDRVHGTLDVVSGLFNVRLLRVGLQGGGGLVPEALSSHIRHCECSL